MAKLLAKLGIDWKTNVQGYQFSWKRIYVWFKEGFGSYDPSNKEGCVFAIVIWPNSRGSKEGK